MGKTRAEKNKELERGLQRVKQQRSSRQRKIIGTAVVMFIILIIVCALLPGGDAAYEGRWEKPVNDRQSKILQSFVENFKYYLTGVKPRIL